MVIKLLQQSTFRRYAAIVLSPFFLFLLSSMCNCAVNWCDKLCFLHLLIVTVRISYRFQDIDALSSKIVFFPPHRCLTPPSGGTLCNINVIIKPPKRTFHGLQFRRWHYGSIFILAAVGSQSREIARNSAKIWPYRSSLQGHPRSSILVSIESSYATSYDSLIVTLAVSATP